MAHNRLLPDGVRWSGVLFAFVATFALAALFLYVWKSSKLDPATFNPRVIPYATRYWCMDSSKATR